MQNGKSLRKLIEAEIDKNSGNNYTDNWDFDLFGPYSASTLRSKLNSLGSQILPSKIYHKALIDYKLKEHLEGLSVLYNNLEDEHSKELLIQVLTHRVIGHKKHKLPLSDQNYWENLELAKSLVIDRNDFIDPRFLDLKLYKHDLRRIGFPIELYFMSFAVLADFIIKQYEYQQGDVFIKAESDDVIIDAGGCWGDTALYFANETGINGKVYSFEFIPSNIAIYKRNLDLNPNLSPQIEIVPNPLWDKSGEKLYYSDFGPASRVSSEKSDESPNEVLTQSIDDFVERNNIQRVDFIKMDIEGAEPFAVNGSRRTLIKHKPKLAISVYHKLSDFYSIIEFLISLDLGYKFYLRHASIHMGETVLFAKV